MFFLGGFNTILPHLLYLSVIWVFLIIGFTGHSGKKLPFTTKQELGYHASTSHTPPASFHVSDTNQATAAQNTNHACFQAVLLCINYPLLITGCFDGHPFTNTSRGPPAL